MRDGGVMNRAEVRTECLRGIGRITLDRPAKFNALTLAMVREMRASLEEWEQDDGVHVVLIEGAGERGLCAGGDLKILYDSARQGDEGARDFWADEYRLDATIAAFPKPIVALMAGTVMGGGVGLSAHARHRIVTSNTRLAMPEARIGLIPDVGATWLLSRVPGESGTYLGLTGARIDAAEAMLLGLADDFVPANAIEPLMRGLLDERPRDDAEICTIVRRFSKSPGTAALAAARSFIDRAFAYDTVEQILAALHDDGSDFALGAAREISGNSPTSVKLTLRALREARGLAGLADCLRLEYRLMNRLLHGHDFREGARAAVVDKDRAPRWQPATLAEVSASDVDAYFRPDPENELQW